MRIGIKPRVDVHAEDENRREFQIEMQLKRDSGLPSRVMDNLSRLYGSQVGKGKPYGGHRQTIAIWILEHRFFGDANWLHVFRFRDDTSGEVLSDELIAITVDLPKREVLPGSGALGTFETGMDEWLWFLEHGDVAKKMLALGIPPETTMAATGVSKEEMSAP